MEGDDKFVAVAKRKDHSSVLFSSHIRAVRLCQIMSEYESIIPNNVLIILLIFGQWSFFFKENEKGVER